ncbi:MULTISPECIES: translation initiation factor IF-3 [unclassified Mesotoga]|uniref:translation initiation factor IF-3 n=1 Tax=unclassified Mesotoga TaxID=1184398 RepID=UPI00215528C7|nr:MULTISPECIES: translation initiation factor IF-3 [unclassified Mesotoga]
MVRGDSTPKNNEIMTKTVRLVDIDGEQLGVVQTTEALRIAREKGLDLVLVAPSANPPVARIMDYGKYKYEKDKRKKEAKKKTKQSQLKEMKFRIRIDEHDFQTKTNRIKEFLEKGSKVRVVIMFRGREIVFSDKGREILERVADQLQLISDIDRPPKLEGRDMWMILKPKAAPQGGKDNGQQSKDEDS